MVMGELIQETEVLVIGGGPGGYAAAFRAADLGLEVTIVEASPRCIGRVSIRRPATPTVTEDRAEMGQPPKSSERNAG